MWQQNSSSETASSGARSDRQHTTSRVGLSGFQATRGTSSKSIERIGMTPCRTISNASRPRRTRRVQTVLRQDPRGGRRPHGRAPLHQAAVEKDSGKGVKIVPVLLHVVLAPSGPSKWERPYQAQDGLGVLRDPALCGRCHQPDHRCEEERVVVGTSTCRALESSVTSDGHLKPQRDGRTSSFFHPMTSDHGHAGHELPSPGVDLLMLVSRLPRGMISSCGRTRRRSRTATGSTAMATPW